MMGAETLSKLGDDPITEFMELDEFYKWSERIMRLYSILFPRTGLTGFQKAVIVAIIVLIALLAAGGVVAFMYS